MTSVWKILVFFFTAAASCYALQDESPSEPFKHHQTVQHALSIVEQKSSMEQMNWLSHSRQIRAAPVDASQSMMRSLEIASHISWHFAETVVYSVLANNANEQRQVDFELRIPDTAFISNFTMLIDGKLHVADVLERERAQHAFDEAIRENRTASLVSAKHNSALSPDILRNTELFAIGLNLPPWKSVDVTLTYQEMLYRRHGVYRQSISIRPDEIIPKLTVNITINEPQGLTSLNVQEPESSRKLATISKPGNGNSTSAIILYSPSVADQISTDDDIGIAGDLVVEYDINRGNEISGQLLTDGKYFVHFVAPEAFLTPLPKRVVFVVDISGSMAGGKMEQTRQAIKSILLQLRPTDSFQLILFNHELQFWPESRRMAGANQPSINDAMKFVESEAMASGMTDINAALIAAFGAIHSSNAELRNSVPMILFLTDGHPTSGITTPVSIWKNVRRAAAEAGTNSPLPIYALGFGFDLDFHLLRVIAEETGGFARRIYDNVDAAIQLERFYEEIGSPLMTDVQMNYPAVAVEPGSTTTSNFAQYFNGSELVVAGRLSSSPPSRWSVSIDARTSDPSKRLTAQKDVDMLILVVQEPFAENERYSVLERLYVHLKIKDLLRRLLVIDDERQAAELRRFALKLALDYHLVTPLTSLSIVQGNEYRDSYAAASRLRLQHQQPLGIMLKEPSAASGLLAWRFLVVGLLCILCCV